MTVRGFSIGADAANNLDIVGLEELQEKLARVQEEIDPHGGLFDTMTLAIGMIHRFATGVVHVDTGRYKNSLFWHVDRAGGRGVTGTMGTNVSYSIYEEARGGSHATFERTRKEEGPNVERLFKVRVDRALED